jgi:hypothetical protein
LNPKGNKRELEKQIIYLRNKLHNSTNIDIIKKLSKNINKVINEYRIICNKEGD